MVYFITLEVVYKNCTLLLKFVFSLTMYFIYFKIKFLEVFFFLRNMIYKRYRPTDFIFIAQLSKFKYSILSQPYPLTKIKLMAEVCPIFIYRCTYELLTLYNKVLILKCIFILLSSWFRTMCVFILKLYESRLSVFCY